MAAKDYVVLFTNPRGSTSYGQEFGNLIQYRYPGDDYKDLMAGVDEVVKRGYVDPNRLGVTGGSGGGLLTNWTMVMAGSAQQKPTPKPTPKTEQKPATKSAQTQADVNRATTSPGKLPSGRKGRFDSIDTKTESLTVVNEGPSMNFTTGPDAAGIYYKPDMNSKRPQAFPDLPNARTSKRRTDWGPSHSHSCRASTPRCSASARCSGAPLNRRMRARARSCSRIARG